jgi:hypothetical protein
LLICCICKDGPPADSHLIDGSAFHHACYERLTNELERSKITERNLLAAIRRPIGFVENFWMFFSASKQQELLAEKGHLSWKLSAERGEIAKLQDKLTALYDVWPTYPPDWDERRDLVGARDSYECAECGAGNIHTHHRRALKDGGTNRPENLVSLCSYCHSQAHGGASFKEGWTPSAANSSLREKIETIQTAITQRRNLFFHYKKPNGATTKRLVAPRELRKLSIIELQALLGRKVPIEKEGRLCLFGHCHLRNEKRTFAVSRIYKLRITDEH